MKMLVDLIKSLIFDEEVVKPKPKVKRNTATKKPRAKTVQPVKKIVKEVPKPRSKKPKSKKDEILEALDYMKSKKGKTKKDKESIYMLEMVLKNMK